MGVTVRTPEIDSAIVEGISQGVTLAELCRRHDIGRRTVYDWMEEDADFAARIARARVLGFDAIAEQALEIAEDGTNDWIERRRDDGSIDELVNSEHIQRSRLRVDTRLKLLAKWDPKRYGDRVQHTGEGGGPIQAAVTVKYVGDDG
jgi:hypothetical protein